MVDVIRLLAGNAALARGTFAVMGGVFGEAPQSAGLSDRYLIDLLKLEHMWAYAALVHGQPVGGITAHNLPMARSETRELMIYDLAVQPEYQRRGVGRSLVQKLLADGAANGIRVTWVPADNDDTHALEFYRRIGGVAQAVTIFTYSSSDL